MWPFMTPQGYSSESNLSGMQGEMQGGGRIQPRTALMYYTNDSNLIWP